MQCGQSNGIHPKPAGGVYISVETRTGAGPGHQVLSLRAAAKQSPAAQVGIASSLALLAMTGEPDTAFPPKTIHYQPARFRLDYGTRLVVAYSQRIGLPPPQVRRQQRTFPAGIRRGFQQELRVRR
jgi:hypothetical protein